LRNTLCSNTYFAWLLVVENPNWRDNSTTNPSVLSKMIPAPPPLVSKAPYVNTVHLKHGSKVNGVNSSRKSANVCAFNSFLSSKVISNSDSSIDHLVVLPFQSFGNGSIVLLMPLSRSRRGYNWSISPLPGRH